MTKRDAAAALSEAGLAVGPVHEAAELVGGPASARSATCSWRWTGPTGDGPPVLVPGNPMKMSRVAEGPEAARALGRRAHRRGAARRTRLRRRRELDRLRAAGVIT